MMYTRLLSVVAVLVVSVTAGIASAQSYLDAGAKARGDYGGSSASRSMGSARSYVQDYRRYATSVPKVDPEVAQDASDAIGGYITKAKKHFAWMRTNAQKANDKET